MDTSSKDIIRLATRGSVGLIAAIASILGTSSAVAQEGAAAPTAGLEEVIVTATRKEEQLQDVPIAVSAFDEAALRSRNITALSDFKPGAVPNVTFVPFAGTSSVLAISIRGVGLSDPSQGTQELAVPVYIDGVFLGRAQGLGLDLVDPERIEILRGPQGQLFGRNAEGGAVQYVTRKPTGEFGVQASASYGNYNYQRYRAVLDLPEAAGFSTEFAALYATRDAFTEQSDKGTWRPQKDYADNEDTGFRAAVRWQNEANDFTADFNYDFSDSTNTQPQPVWQPVKRLRFDTATQTYVPITPVAPIPASKDYPDKTGIGGYNTDFDVGTSGYGLTLAWDLNDTMTVKSITAYRTADRTGGSTLLGSLPAGASSTGFFFPWAGEFVHQNQTSEELQFIGSWSEFSLTAGGIYYNENVDDKRISNLNGDGLNAPALGLAPASVGYCVAFAANPCITGGTRQNSQTDSWGLYAQGTYSPDAFDKKLDLIVGLRYSDDSKDAKRTSRLTPIFPLSAAGVYDPTWIRPNFPVNDNPLRADFSTTRTDPAVTVQYKWTDVLNTYARYATGYRAGGANVRSSIFSGYDDEEVDAWELGLKSTFADNTVRANLALFYNTIKKEQINVQEAPTVNPSLTNTINAPKDKTVKGAELEMYWAAMEELGLGLNIAYMNADDWYDYVNPFSLTGQVLRYWSLDTPEFSGSLYVDYTHPLESGQLAFHANYAYSDDYWQTPGAIPVVELAPGYKRPTSSSSQLSARLSWREIDVGGGKMAVSLWGNNLTDDNAITYGFDGCAFGGGFCSMITDPRMYGLEVRFDY